MVEVGDVAGGEHPVDVRTAALVDDDSVVDLDRGLMRELRGGLHAKGEHGEVACQAFSVSREHCVDAVAAFDRRHAIAWDEAHPVRPMDLVDRPAHGLSKNLGERVGVTHDDGDLEAHPPERRRHLRADEAHAPDHDRTALDRLRPEPVAVVHGTQQVNAFRAGPRKVRNAVAASRRKQQPVERQLLAIGEAHGSALDVERVGPGTGPEVHAVLGPEAVRANEQLLERHLSTQVGLRELRPLVRLMGLLPHQHDLTTEPLLPQRGRCGGAREARSDDHDSLRGIGHQSRFLIASAATSKYSCRAAATSAGGSSAPIAARMWCSQ
jgi:hypothetical protein